MASNSLYDKCSSARNCYRSFLHILATIFNSALRVNRLTQSYSFIFLLLLPFTHSTGIYLFFLLLYSKLNCLVLDRFQKISPWLFTCLYVIQFPVYYYLFEYFNIFQRDQLHVIGLQLGIPLGLICLVLFFVVYFRIHYLHYERTIPYLALFIFSSLCLSVILTSFNSQVAERLFPLVLAMVAPYVLNLLSGYSYYAILFFPVFLTTITVIYGSILSNSAFNSFCSQF